MRDSALRSRLRPWLLILGALLLLPLAPDGRAAARAPVLVLQSGHAATILSVAFRPDGRILASADLEGEVRLWEVATGRVLARLRGEEAAWTADGRLLLTTSATGLSLWDARTGRLLRRLASTPCGFPAAPSRPAEGRAGLAAVVEEGEVVVWDLREGQVRWRLPAGEGTRSLAFGDRGRLLAAGGPEGVRVWEVDRGTPLGLLRPAGPPASLGENYMAALHPEKPLVAVAEQGALGLWTPEGRLLRSLPASRFPDQVAFSPDGRRLAGTDEDLQLTVWDLETGKVESKREVGEWYGQSARAFLAWSPDSRLLATGGPGPLVQLWPLDPGAGQARPFRGTTLNNLQVRPSPGGGRLALLGMLMDRLVGESWALDPLRSEGGFECEEPPQVVFWGANQDRAVLSFQHSGTMEVRTLEGGSRELPGEEAMGSWYNAAVSPDGKTLATVGDTSLNLWDLEAGQVVRRLEGPPRGPECVDFSADGSRVGAAGPEGAAVWDVRSGKRLYWHPGGGAPSTFSPSLDRVAATSLEDGTWTVYDLAGGRPLLRLPAGSARFLGEDRIALADPQTMSTTVWDLDQGKPAGTLEGIDPDLMVSMTEGRLVVTCLGQELLLHRSDLAPYEPLPRVPGLGHAFYPGGKLFLAARADGGVDFWSLETGRLLATLVVLPSSDGAECVVVSPEGFFDGTPGGWQSVLWRVGDDLLAVAEPEEYFQDFFQPGLLRDVVREARPITDRLRARGDPRADLTVASRDRRLPRVAIQAPSESGEREVVVTLDLGEAPPDQARPEPSGIRDVRLFRNGSLVARWPGDRDPGQVKARVTLVPGRNDLVAYAFNRDDVKSKDARCTVEAAPSVGRPGQARVLAVGIDRYSQPWLDLRFATADAEAMVRALAGHLPFPADRISARTLLNEQATRAGVVGALEKLAGEAGPEDTVIVTWSGHGVLQGGHFYLLPHDVAEGEGAASLVDRAISETDLEAAFMPIDAGNLVLVLDACHSGGALESSDERRGPLNSRGLAQLAWEKGMEIVAASQTQQAAVEVWEMDGMPIGHGLLTYALAVEGLDKAPRPRGRLLARDWLDYAASRVPGYLKKQGVQRRAAQLEGGLESVQTPRVFYRREGGGKWVVSGP